MFAEQLTTEAGRELGGLVVVTVHFRGDGRVVFDYDSDFRIVGAELRAVVHVGAAEDYDAVVGDQELSVDVQLLADKGVDLILLRPEPGDVFEGRAALHVARADAVILGPIAAEDLGRGLLISVQVGVWLAAHGSSAKALAGVARSYDIIMLLCGVPVGDSAGLLNLGHGLVGFDAVVVPQVIEADVFLWLGNPGFLQGPDDAMIPSADGIILVFHDGSGSKRLLSMQVTGKARNGGNADDDLVRFAGIVGPENTLYDGSSDLVLDWMLLIGGSGDEELILDVDKVLTVVNHLDVCIGNRVLLGSA